MADTNDRQLYLSLGTSLENILEAADYYCYETQVEYNNTDSDLAATINLSKKNFTDKQLEDHLGLAILERRTNRSAYHKKDVPKDFIDKIMDLEKDGIKIFLIDNKEQKAILADIAVRASVASLEDPAFRAELSTHLKSNTTNSKIGMPGFSVGLPTPISYLLPHLMKRINMEKIATKKNLVLLREQTPLLTVMAAADDSKESWIKTGEIYQEMGLIAHQYGISFSPWGAPIQIGDFYKEIQKTLNTSLRPQMFFRVGYASKPAKESPRLEAKDVLKL